MSGVEDCVELVIDVTAVQQASWNDRVCTGLVRRPLCKLRECAAAYTRLAMSSPVAFGR